MFIKTLITTFKEHGVSVGLRLANYYVLKASAALFGPGRECPICGWNGPEFRPIIVMPYAVIRKKVMCPRCGSYERHRAYKFFYDRFFSEAENINLKDILHFAPEVSLEETLRSHAAAYHKSNYENPADGEFSLDLRDLALPDRSYDVMIMNYVLSCMPEDDKAVKSMYRVLRGNGVVLAGDGVSPDQRTEELKSVGYGGLHRCYGMLDLEERFAPFSVKVVDAAADLSPEQRERFGINANEMVIVLRKLP